MAKKEELGGWRNPEPLEVQKEAIMKSEARKSAESKQFERLRIEYMHLLKDYDRTFSKLKGIQRRFPGAATDPEVQASLRVVDDERHEIHLKLLAAGEKLGKNKQDVWVDILREQGTLEEYGLPEFVIMKASDFLGGNRRRIAFNLEKMRPERPSTVTLEEAEGHLGGYDEKEGVGPNEVVIVFNVSPTFSYEAAEYDRGIEINPPDIEIRQDRATALAGTVGGRILSGLDEFPHDSSMEVLGVVVPKDKLDQAAATIRNNPYKFRIGKEFYSEGELAQIEEYFKNGFGGKLHHIKEEDRRAYVEKYEELYGKAWPTIEKLAKA